MDRERFLRELTGLRETVKGDLIAYGHRGLGSRAYRWRMTLGSMSGRCEEMAFRSGSGIGGQAVRIGKPLLWAAGSEQLERLRRECPLLQAEQVRSALTVPVPTAGGGEQPGVLLVGRRDSVGFTPVELVLAVSAAERLVVYLADRPARNGGERCDG